MKISLHKIINVLIKTRIFHYHLLILKHHLILYLTLFLYYYQVGNNQVVPTYIISFIRTLICYIGTHYPLYLRLIFIRIIYPSSNRAINYVVFLTY